MTATPGQAPIGPGRAAWLKSVELWGPGHAATFDDLPDLERGQWALIAQAGMDGSEYVRELERRAAREPHAAPAVNDCPIAVVLADGMHDCTLTAGHGGDHDFADEVSGAQEPHAAPGLAEQLRLVQADLADAEAEIGRWPRCPAGCRCRIGTEDADALECGCDGPCTTGWEFPPAPSSQSGDIQ